MRIGVTLEDDKGLESNVSMHFGQCSHFLIVDIENGEIKDSKVVPNNTQHGGGGCVAVDAILEHNITHVIAGGMGMGAQQKFSSANVAVFGFSGLAEDAIKKLLNDNLTGLGACKEHGDCH
ncbi:MAG: NifB/NifX family molybdenum-iron cluster-binding protein [Candidatus Omnitrophica bacterium]|nr:NifB/NifX family molybdenum-iron cluster-binding protein [Candidatus Omnitrophota bacterium]MBU1997309.1 NifB/NifX family molybdenum-iron cluster-binding protein [Candidatus Omnitrophota bacterium]MBU4332914.1 NifB/NifX family molybdenum-iron cluster-binding protein [Candidatus Omnitrophota bacterium]